MVSKHMAVSYLSVWIDCKPMVWEYPAMVTWLVKAFKLLAYFNYDAWPDYSGYNGADCVNIVHIMHSLIQYCIIIKASA